MDDLSFKINITPLIQAVNRLAYVTALASLMNDDPNFDAYRRDMQNMLSVIAENIDT